MKTLNQIKATLSTLAANHAQIGAYGDGREWDIEANGAKTPAVMWSVLRNAELAERKVVIVYDIFILDLVRPDESHLDDVMSDTLSIALDVMASLDDDDASVDIYAIPTGTLEPAFEEFDNTWYGWHFEVKFELPWNKDTCQIPTN